MITLRPMRMEEEPFVVSSWFASFRNSHHKDMDFDAYKEGMNRQITRLLEKSNVLVASLVEVPDEVLGYAILEGEACHWVYVKSTYRKQHVAKALLSNVRTYSLKPKTKSAKAMVESLSLKFNPFTRE